MKFLAAVLWVACLVILALFYTEPVARLGAVFCGLLALGASMNVWSNRNDH